MSVFRVIGHGFVISICSTSLYLLLIWLLGDISEVRGSIFAIVLGSFIGGSIRGIVKERNRNKRNRIPKTK
ncbi:hypothetical protein ACE1TH_01355 [Shouchella sp. JSM 1781072]|uniref:hypothetical protein n=1 Tax=Bacillaceae TaxID=186817 RepID=UPI001145E20E|nr:MULTISPECIES: hypothetical protein [Bacillaceae]UTR05468.1 hypothetical protein MM326_15330 [Alkalihalobacillus sp. LMS6]